MIQVYGAEFEMDDKQRVIILTATEVRQLEVRREQPDEREPNKIILGTYLDNKLIARQPSASEELADNFERALKNPVTLEFRAREDKSGGIEARIFALVPITATQFAVGEGYESAEEWERAEREERSAIMLVYLGNIVRLQSARTRTEPDELMEETIEMFYKVLAGETVEPIEQVMTELGLSTGQADGNG